MHKFNIYFISISLLLLLMTGYSSAGSTSTDRMSIIKTTKTDINKQAYSTIKITYPVIKNISNSKELNHEVTQTMDDLVRNFKKNLSENQPIKPIADLPLKTDSNNLEINYKTFSATKNIISIRFSIYTFFYGAAHPFTTYQSLNYDVSKGKVLSLNDIFKSNDYLQFLSTYSKKVLTQKLSKAGSPTEPDSEGIKPIAENFKIWNITPNGLLLTFPPYQVAAYVFGPQEVLIPYSEINNMLLTQYH